MDEFFTSAGVALAALFPIIDPIGNVPWLLRTTRGLSVDERRSMVLRGVVISVAMLTVFLLFGHFVLDFFSVSLAAVEFVGGLVIGWVGWGMLTQPIETPSGAAAEPDAGEEVEDIAFIPLAFPLLAGPGALAITLGLSNRHDTTLDYVGFVGGIARLVYLILSRAEIVLRWIGPPGYRRAQPDHGPDRAGDRGRARLPRDLRPLRADDRRIARVAAPLAPRRPPRRQPPPTEGFPCVGRPPIASKKRSRMR